MRASSWRIVWDPLGDAPRVLLDYGDAMPDEIAQQFDGSTDIGRFDFAASGRPVSKGNVKRRISFTRLQPHETVTAAWMACPREIASDPWGITGTMGVTRDGGEQRLFKAALLSSEHQPSIFGPWPESSHSYSFRVGMPFVAGPPITVTGGSYNPITGGITITISDPFAVPLGSTVKVQGVPGVPDGTYPVVASNDGELLLTGEPREAPAVTMPAVTLGPTLLHLDSQYYTVTFPVRILLPTEGGWTCDKTATGDPLVYTASADSVGFVAAESSAGDPSGLGAWGYGAGHGLDGISVEVPKDPEQVITGEPFADPAFPDQTIHWQYRLDHIHPGVITVESPDGLVLQIGIAPRWTGTINCEYSAADSSATDSSDVETVVDLRGGYSEGIAGFTTVAGGGRGTIQRVG